MRISQAENGMGHRKDLYATTPSIPLKFTASPTPPLVFGVSTALGIATILSTAVLLGEKLL